MVEMSAKMAASWSSEILDMVLNCTCLGAMGVKVGEVSVVISTLLGCGVRCSKNSPRSREYKSLGGVSGM